MRPARAGELRRESGGGWLLETGLIERPDRTTRTKMGDEMRKMISGLVLAGLLAGTGCASTSDMTQLKSDVATAQADAAEARRIAEEARDAAAAAQSDASAARAAADAAATEARTASEKADRIFQRSLHK
jgi:murein lipoprotein